MRANAEVIIEWYRRMIFEACAAKIQTPERWKVYARDIFNLLIDTPDASDLLDCIHATPSTV